MNQNKRNNLILAAVCGVLLALEVGVYWSWRVGFQRRAVEEACERGDNAMCFQLRNANHAACERKDAAACVKEGCLLVRGLGGAENAAQGQRLFRLGCSYGNSLACRLAALDANGARNVCPKFGPGVP